MMHDPKELNDFLLRILKKFNVETLDGSPFLHLVKPTSENLVKYKLRYPASRVYFAISVLAAFPRIILLIINSLAISLLRTQENFKRTPIQKKHYRRLIISQFTSAQNAEEQDIFYGSNTQTSDTLIFYLNSTRRQAHKIQADFINAGKSNVIVNSKSLWMLEIIKLHLKQVKGSFSLLTYAVFNSENSIIERRLLIEASVFQHARSTIANQVLKVRLSQVLRDFIPAEIVMMTEGHAHEAMILNLRNKEFTSIRILGYQHAPIVPGQFALWHLLNQFDEDDMLLACGATTQRVIQTNHPNLKVKILGSLKSKSSVDKPKNSKFLEVLGVVEGTRESLIEFVSLFNFLATSIPNVEFTLRVHPGLERHNSVQILKKLVKLKNLRVSTGTLSEDLQRSHIGVFRSSAVALEGLAFGVLPVHFDATHFGYLNPIEFTKLTKVEFSDPKILADFLRKMPLADISNQSFQDEFRSVLKDYFYPLRMITSLIQ
jgi:hypothetical protein